MEHHHHPKPMHRFRELLRYDQHDIWRIVLFAFVGGILSLATPLAIESMVNVVSWGSQSQQILVLAGMLLTCLGFSGLLKILQTMVVESIQQRQFIRIVGDFAHRFPRAHVASLLGEYPRELANRIFDIMTIQKATAVLLLDGVSLAITTVLGLILLACYHPFLLGFDLVLLICMISITWILGRGGIRTAIDESKAKYHVAHWLQDVIAMPATFKVNGGGSLAVECTNRLATEYVVARQQQFRVVIRQVTFAIVLQVVASTVLLGLGGWLVIQQQLTLGQLVASELVVTVVVGAFAKAGKSLEKYYDLMAGIDKVGHLLDIPVDPQYPRLVLPDGPINVKWGELRFELGERRLAVEVPPSEIRAGSRVVLRSEQGHGGVLLQALAGLRSPDQGSLEVGPQQGAQLSLSGQGAVALVSGTEIFHGTIEQNISLERSDIDPLRIREALLQVGLWDELMRLPAGLQTELQTDGYPFESPQITQIMLARAIAGTPKLLLVDSFDVIPKHVRERIWKAIAIPEPPWTLILVTTDADIMSLSDRVIDIREVSL